MPVKNICHCHNPPGGRVECEPHQMAICGVINGVVRRECVDPPHEETPMALINWALARVTGERRSAHDLITAKDFHSLMGGEYRRPNGEIVKCVVPIKIVEAMNLLIMRGSDR